MNNKNLNIRLKIVSVIVKLASFMIFWRVFSNSPLFYGAKFLWINNLALVDQLSITNLFGLLKYNVPLLPNASLLSLITIALFYFEIKTRNTNLTAEQAQQNQMSILVILVVFLFGVSNMPAVFCLYLLINNLLDHLQNYVFSMLKNNSKPTRRSVGN